MDHFLYRDGVLCAEDVPVAEIAAAVGTPFYVYSTATLLRHYNLFDEALAGTDHVVCYAMKAASNQAILKTLAQAGAGMDVVSGGEYLRAKAAGVPGEKIVFSGVGKTAEEIRIALTGGIRQFNVESEPEMEVINAVAQELGVIAPITVRVNRMSTPRRTPKSPRENPRTSSASRSPAHPRSMPMRPACPASRWWASTCISARN